MPGQRPGTDGRGPPPQSFCPSRSTDGRRYVPRFVPSGSRLGLSGSTAWRLQGVKGGWRPPCSGCVGPTASSSGAQRQWRSIGARSMLDARSFMISTLRSQVSFAAAIGPLRKPASASHVLSSSRHRGLQKSRCTAGRYASAARAFISPTAFEQARGGALGAGGGRVGFAGGGLFRVQAPLLSRPRGAFGSGAAAVEPAADSGIRSSRGCAGVLAGLDGSVVRFVCVFHVLVCARACPVCFPGAPPGVFLR